MIDQKTVDLIVGTIATMGGIIFVLNKFNLVRFGKKKCDVICDDHENVVAKLNDIQAKQQENVKLHENHAQKFSEGKKEFEKIQSSLKTISESVAVLLDRTGGRPKGL